MGKKKRARILVECQTHIVLTFFVFFFSFQAMFLLTSCELVTSLTDWSLQSKATSLPYAYCLIHCSTHFYHTLASLTVHTHFLSNSLNSKGSSESQKEQRGQQMPPNKIQMEFHMRCLGATTISFIALQKETKMWSYAHLSWWRTDSLFRHSGLGHHNLLLIRWFRPLMGWRAFKLPHSHQHSWSGILNIT